VHTLDEKRIKLGNLLATDVKAELGGVGSILGEETIGVGSDIGDVGILDPNVAHEVTLRANRNGDFVVRAEGTDVVHPLRLHREVSMALIVLTEKAHLWITSDEYILGSDRHELN
tara:strand:- start:815 stop:1159 length:345 start_codon:yes stop_codon:yes gene_type:complete